MTRVPNYSRKVIGVVLLAVLAYNPDLACAILNDRSVTLSTTTESSVLTLPSSGEGHDKVFRLGTTAARKRRLQLPFLSTAAPPVACECMDYWECISNNGQIYSYCGIHDSEVCCFQSHHRAGNQKQRNSSKNNIRLPDGLVATITDSETTVPPTLFTRPTFLSATSTRYPDDTTQTAFSSIFATAATLPDVDYFYALEDGIGDLKQITIAKQTEQPVKVIATTSPDPNYGGFSCGTQLVRWQFDSKAEFKEWPWHVALLEIKEDLYVCGASLISNEVIITAAHCVYPYVKKNSARLKVRAGEYDVSTNDETDPYIEAVVEKIFVHPKFDNATLVNDIALVKLRKPLNYTSNIRPICLPDIKLQSHYPKNCVVTGWGRHTETTPFSLVMKEIVVPLWMHAECENKLQSNFGTAYKLAATSICAGERGHDACDGDGGGGLVCFDEHQKRFYLKGITSFGIGCGRLDTPGVYTDVTSYLSWIDSLHYLEAE